MDIDNDRFYSKDGKKFIDNWENSNMNLEAFMRVVNNINDYAHEIVWEKQVFQDKLEEMGVNTYKLIQHANIKLKNEE